MLVVELKVQSQPIVIVHFAGPGRSNRLEKVMTAVGMVKEADARKTRLLFRQADFQPETVKACRIYRLTIHRSHHVCARPFANAYSAILLFDGRVESEPERGQAGAVPSNQQERWKNIRMLEGAVESSSMHLHLHLKGMVDGRTCTRLQQNAGTTLAGQYLHFYACLIRGSQASNSMDASLAKPSVLGLLIY